MNFFNGVNICAALFVEELLNSFAGQPGSWRHCLYFLSNSRNEYVMMYSLTVFEVRIHMYSWPLLQCTYYPCYILTLIFIFRTWSTKCGSVQPVRIKQSFVAACQSCCCPNMLCCPSSSEISSAKSLWTSDARTGPCSTMTFLAILYRYLKYACLSIKLCITVLPSPFLIYLYRWLSKVVTQVVKVNAYELVKHPVLGLVPLYCNNDIHFLEKSFHQILAHGYTDLPIQPKQQQ